MVPAPPLAWLTPGPPKHRGAVIPTVAVPRGSPKSADMQLRDSQSGGRTPSPIKVKTPVAPPSSGANQGQVEVPSSPGIAMPSAPPPLTPHNRPTGMTTGWSGSTPPVASGAGCPETRRRTCSPEGAPLRCVPSNATARAGPFCTFCRGNVTVRPAGFGDAEGGAGQYCHLYKPPGEKKHKTEQMPWDRRERGTKKRSGHSNHLGTERLRVCPIASRHTSPCGR